MGKIKGWEKTKGTSGFMIVGWRNQRLSKMVRVDKLPYKKPEYEVYIHNILTGETNLVPMDLTYNKADAMKIASNTMHNLNYDMRSHPNG